MKFLILFLTFSLFLSGCNNDSSSNDSEESKSSYSIELEMQRIEKSGFDDIKVIVTLKKDGTGFSGQNLKKVIPKGSVSTVTDLGSGKYSFTISPSATGEYPVTVSYDSSSIKRTAIVLDTNLSGTGQPMAIPGDYVNTEGYEDGATITPDGEYLFVQYGPFYFSGILYYSTICNSSTLSAGYDLNNCHGNTDSELVFDTVGPYANKYRPNFPVGNIVGGELVHLDDLVLSGYFNGIVAFPTVFYGFKRQSDGTFAEPFKLAFNDEKGVNGPFGPSFIMKNDGTVDFVIAWNNYFDGNADGGTATGEDDKPDVYYGNLTLGTDKNLGDVVFASNDGFYSISPNITPVSFTSHSGVQGNPHAYSESGVVKSIWTDDEQVSHNLSVYTISSGTFPNGTWNLVTLPSKIATSAEENQPFFTGTKLYFRRGSSIVSHEYKPTNGSCASGFAHNDCWGDEEIVIGANGNTTDGTIFSVGEPTIATRDGKNYLYFVYVLKRSNAEVSQNDWNINVGFVEI